MPKICGTPETPTPGLIQPKIDASYEPSPRREPHLASPWLVDVKPACEADCWISVNASTRFGLLTL